MVGQCIHTIPTGLEFTINNNRISHQQLWNVIIITVIVLDLQCIFGFNMPADQMSM